jgi:hypothetical protein
MARTIDTTAGPRHSTVHDDRAPAVWACQAGVISSRRTRPALVEPRTVVSTSAPPRGFPTLPSARCCSPPDHTPTRPTVTPPKPVPLACPIRRTDAVARGTSRRRLPHFTEIIAWQVTPGIRGDAGHLVPKLIMRVRSPSPAPRPVPEVRAAVFDPARGVRGPIPGLCPHVPFDRCPARLVQRDRRLGCLRPPAGSSAPAASSPRPSRAWPLARPRS